MATLSGHEIPSNWSSLGALNPELERLLAASPNPNLQLVTEKTTIESLRAMGAARPPSQPWSDVQERDVLVRMRDGHENRIRLYNWKDDGSSTERTLPSNRPPVNGPLLVMIHGGGFCVGSLEAVEGNCRKWVQQHGGTAISISHRLAPDVKFPVPVEDCWDTVQWIAANSHTFEADTSKGFILGGVSSGASASAIISHLARDVSLKPQITGLYLSIPLPCVPSALPEPYASDPRIVSWEQCKDAPVFNRRALELFARTYNADPTSPLRSPLLFPSGHADLPPMYLQVAGADPTRDYGLLYEEVLKDAGVKTRADAFPGLPHGFWRFFPQAEFSKDFWRKTDEGFRWLLKLSV